MAVIWSSHSAALAHGAPSCIQAVRPALQTSGCAPLQRAASASHTGGEHVPAEQSAVVAQASPCRPSRFDSHCRLAAARPCSGVRLARTSASRIVPVAALQSAAVAHAMPMGFQPVWSGLQTCGCAPLQRVWPDVQAASSQVPFVLQSAAVAQPCLAHGREQVLVSQSNGGQETPAKICLAPSDSHCVSYRRSTSMIADSVF